MLATVAFLAFWIVVGLALFFFAIRGGRRAGRPAGEVRGRSRRRAMLTGFLLFYLLAGVALPYALITGNEDSESAKADNGTVIRLTAQEQRGRELFADRCANCHRLAAAGASGQVGPSLDQLTPPAALVRDAIINGRQRGAGTMPAGLLEGIDADDVAAFVEATAGR